MEVTVPLFSINIIAQIQTTRRLNGIRRGVWLLANTVSEESTQSRHRKRTISRTANLIGEWRSSTMPDIVATSSTLGSTENHGWECHSPR
jgi:hypothetical protein